MTTEDPTQFLRQRGYLGGALLVALGMLVSSTIGLGVRMTDVATAWQILVYRSVGTVVFLILVIVVRNPRVFGTLAKQIELPGIAGGFGLMLASCGVIVAFDHTTVANALFLVAAAPFITALLGGVLLSERVRPATWFAITLSLIGVAVMVGEGLSLGNFWGNAAGLVAALGLAIFSVSLRWGQSSDLLLLALVGGCMTFVVSTMATIATGAGFSIPIHDILISLSMGAFQLGCALLLIIAGSKSVPAADIAVIGLVEIVLAPVWVWLIFGESVGLVTLIGGAVVLIAIFVDTFTGVRPDPNESTSDT
jgi:drug/metabolite transporter, DME family